MATPWRTLLAAGAISAGSLAAPAHAGDGSWAWPLDGDVSAQITPFDSPDNPYAAGHRGIDLPGVPGGDVRAVAPGVVTFAGRVASLGVVTIDHGAERSTYQPVDATVTVGQEVESGDVVGRLLVQGSHCAGACLHLGRIDDTRNDGGRNYLDPAERLATTSTIRLVDPDGPLPVPPLGPTGSGILQRPVAGPITSPYGMRRHPVTHENKLHDGIDFAAACRTAVRAAADGVVRSVGHSGAYGNHVVLTHQSGLTTLYGHLSRVRTHVGDAVTTSTIIGTVGSTGLSTGCHLHLGAALNGASTDPARLL